MDQRLSNIAKAIAQSAINGFNNRAVPMYYGEMYSITRAVYDELMIGAKAKSNPWKLSSSAAKAAIISHWRQTRGYFNHHWLNSLENDSMFVRAHTAAHATLQKMIRTTNHNERLNKAYSM